MLDSDWENMPPIVLQPQYQSSDAHCASLMHGINIHIETIQDKVREQVMLLRLTNLQFYCTKIFSFTTKFHDILHSHQTHNKQTIKNQYIMSLMHDTEKQSETQTQPD